MTDIGTHDPTTGPLHGAAGRSWLFVPGDRPDRFDKAVGSGADHVILDLEDAVGASSKAEARRHVATWLAGPGSGWVRINAIDSAWGRADVLALAECGRGLRGLVLPKADAAAVAEIAASTGSTVAVMALIESARGLVEVSKVADHPQVAGVAFGSLDYALDLGSDDPGVLDHARYALVVAARAAGLADVVDGVSPGVDDVQAVRRDTARARSLGFSGKLCIHPRQVPAVHEGLAPTADELAWAAKVLAAADSQAPDVGAFQVDGEMVDRPVLLRARRLAGRAAS